MTEDVTLADVESDGAVDAFELDPLACPGVFYPTQALDGVLSRIRTPGGLLTATQARVLADVAEAYAGGTLTVTNRANVQLRALDERLPVEVLRRLQRAGLASHQPAVDHLRNIMTSPTAGLDPDALLDTRPLVRVLDAYLEAHPELGVLSAKFSIGIDGGEHASIAAQPNDVLFSAFRDTAHDVRFRVYVRIGNDPTSVVDLGLALTSDQVVPLTAALADVYLTGTPAVGTRPRLRQVLADRSVEALRADIAGRVPGLAQASPREFNPCPPHSPVGVHAQVDDGVVYVGLAPFLGALTSTQLRGLADFAERLGSGSLRLSPWRNVLVPDVSVADVEALQAGLDALGLASYAEALAAGIVACAGRAGCGAGLVDTVRDAQALSARLEGMPLAGPPTIHFTGCAKCCAQRGPADVTLLGRAGDIETYDIFVAGAGDARLGRLVRPAVPAAAVVDAVAELLAEVGR